ncbi:hypothetical protein HPB49_012702 [Dermacentor silvarum]|uniref:Uncharacterized protein n=1 Tax=Dermacentor silvarum TaxID=543639 RepID=A0ACB8CFA1_DERSI|nr:hypothetical protein HPB49_012702 [Dermacentor silvarum]
MDTSEGWKDVRYRRSHRQASQHRESTLSPTWPYKRNDNPRKGRLEQIRNASRMPHLPRGDYKIVIRPRGALKISEHGIVHLTAAVQDVAGIPRDEREEDIVCPNNYQNILIVSASYQEHAIEYQEVARIKIQDKFYEANAYETAPDMTAKGVIRGIPLDEGPRDITAAVVTNKNPMVIAAKRISNTTTVIVLFEGYKVPTYVRYRAALLRCSLYRKQVDFCNQCYRLGHRGDVCPNPNNKICAGCGTANPEKDHRCQPKSQLYSEDHPTADKTCKAKFKNPFIVKQRQWQRLQRELKREHEDATSRENRAESRGRPNARERRSRSRTRSPSTPRSLSRSSSRTPGRRPGSRSRSRTRPPTSASTTTTVSWADVVDGKRPGAGGDTAINNEIKELKHENAQLRIMLARMSDKIKSLKEAKSQLNQRGLALPASAAAAASPSKALSTACSSKQPSRAARASRDNARGCVGCVDCAVTEDRLRRVPAVGSNRVACTAVRRVLGRRAGAATDEALRTTARGAVADGMQHRPSCRLDGCPHDVVAVLLLLLLAVEVTPAAYIRLRLGWAMECLKKMRAARRAQQTRLVKDISGLIETNEFNLATLRTILQRLEKSTNELTKINGELHAEMSDDEVAADYDSVLEYEDQAAGALGLLRHHILELSNPPTTGTGVNDDRNLRPTAEEDLEDLLQYFRVEVDCRERTAHGPLEGSSRQYLLPGSGRRQTPPSSAAVLKNSATETCVFCEKCHATSVCDSSLDHNEKRRLLMASGSCFRCTTKGHRAQDCRRKMSVGREEHIDMAQLAVSNTIDEVTEALISVSARRKSVDFSLTPAAKDEAKAAFARRGAIPGDSSHGCLFQYLACSEGQYSREHTSMRNVVERFIGLLKSKFRCFQHFRTLLYSPDRAARIIYACVALHNIALDIGLLRWGSGTSSGARRQPSAGTAPRVPQRKAAAQRRYQLFLKYTVMVPSYV